jgi:hypothetical protein
MPPSGLKPHSGRYLTFAEREEIAICRAYGFGIREIARHLGRSASTISRELRRNAATRGGTLHYRAVVAQWKAEPADVSSKGQQARRQRPAARVCAGPAVRCVDRPGSTSPMMSRCGFRTRRSARPFTFGDVGRRAAS